MRGELLDNFLSKMFISIIYASLLRYTSPAELSFVLCAESKVSLKDFWWWSKCFLQIRYFSYSNFSGTYSAPTSTTISHWLRRSLLRVLTITILTNHINLYTMGPVFGEKSEHWNRKCLIWMKSTVTCSNSFSAFRDHICINFSGKAMIHSITNIRREQIYSLYTLLTHDHKH